MSLRDDITNEYNKMKKLNEAVQQGKPTFANKKTTFGNKKTVPAKKTKYTMPGTFVGRPVDQVGKGDPKFPLKQPAKKVAPQPTRNVDISKSTDFTKKVADSAFKFGNTPEMPTGAVSRKPQGRSTENLDYIKNFDTTKLKRASSPSQPAEPFTQEKMSELDPTGLFSRGISRYLPQGTATPSAVKATNPSDARQLERDAMNPSGAPTPVPVGLDGKRRINAGIPTPSVIRATNQADARQLQRDAMNPSGAYTPVPRGLDGKTPADRPTPFNQQQSPSLWSRIKNFLGFNAGVVGKGVQAVTDAGRNVGKTVGAALSSEPRYQSGWGSDAEADSYAMRMQKRNAAMAGTDQQPAAPARPAAPAVRPASQGGAGAEGDEDSLEPTSKPKFKGLSKAGAQGNLYPNATKKKQQTGTRGGVGAEGEI